MAQLSSLTPWQTRTPRLYLQTRGGVADPTSSRGRLYWVVARDLCRFFQVPLVAGATLRQQLDALVLQIRRLSPFEETGSHFHVGTTFISLWLWDEKAVREAADAAGVDIARLRVVPETALKPALPDGVRIVETLDGVEGQSWIGGGLAASRWWPAPPDDRGWILFQRGASVAQDRISAAPPPVLRLDWLDRPWTRMPSLASDGLAKLDVRLVAAGVCALMVLALGYLSAEWLRLANDIGDARAENAERLNKIEPELQARNSALTNQAMIDSLRALDKYPSQITLMARVAEILPRNDTHLTDWIFDKGQLEMTIVSEKRLDAVYFVKALEAIRNFKSVAAERANTDNSLRIRMVVNPK